MDSGQMFGCKSCEAVWLLGHYDDGDLWRRLLVLAVEYSYRQQWWLTIQGLVFILKSIRHRTGGKYWFCV